MAHLDCKLLIHKGELSLLIRRSSVRVTQDPPLFPFPLRPGFLKPPTGSCFGSFKACIEAVPFATSPSALCLGPWHGTTPWPPPRQQEHQLDTLAQQKLQSVTQFRLRKQLLPENDCKLTSGC